MALTHQLHNVVPAYTDEDNKGGGSECSVWWSWLCAWCGARQEAAGQAKLALPAASSVSSSNSQQQQPAQQPAQQSAVPSGGHAAGSCQLQGS